jgi:hypothetical protein
MVMQPTPSGGGGAARHRAAPQNGTCGTVAPPAPPSCATTTPQGGPKRRISCGHRLKRPHSGEATSPAARPVLQHRAPRVGGLGDLECVCARQLWGWGTTNTCLLGLQAAAGCAPALPACQQGYNAAATAQHHCCCHAHLSQARPPCRSTQHARVSGTAHTGPALQAGPIHTASVGAWPAG